MPYALTQDAGGWTLRLWPHNALPARGFVIVIGLSAAVLALPLLAVLGHPVLWGLLPFATVALWGLWYALQRNWRDRSIIEELRLSRRAIHLTHKNPHGPLQEWRADPAWVTLNLIPRNGPVAQYLTLTGGGREVELGAFLTPAERIALHEELSALLVSLKSYV